jgi:ATP-dependent Lon protease
MTFTGRSGQVFAETASAAAAPVAALARLAASKQDAKARWIFIVCPRETGAQPSAGPDYGSAGTAFLGIRVVFAGKTGFLQVYGAARCPIYDLFLVAN